MTATKRIRISPFLGASLLALGLAPLGTAGLSAETLESALSRAYVASPLINATRAGVRATDENVPRALAGYRPQISATADIGRTWSQQSLLGNTTTTTATPRSFGIQLNQNIYDGNRTANGVRQAESFVMGARYQLDATVQQTLFDAASAYMNVLQNTAILNLQRNNVDVLEEQLRQTQDRFEVGEVTRTDVAQSEATLAGSRSQVSLAEANLRASIAQYRLIIGSQPRQLAAGRAPDRMIPGNLDAAVAIALAENPSIAVAQFNADAAELQVKIAEGALAPTVGVAASVNQRYDSTGNGGQVTDARIVASLNVPIYQGGAASAAVRQAKETAAQRRFEVAQARDQVRFAVVAAWGSLEAARAQIAAAQVQVEAAETALTGVREEARVGQRTTLDVLNAQLQLLNARVNLITAQRDRVVQSYAVVQAMGRLTPERLALNAPVYDPKVHYDQVRGLLWGTSTPSGGR